MSAKSGGRGRGKGRGRGRGRGEGTSARTGEEDEGSPEYLPPRHQRELLGEGSNHNPGPSRGLRSRIPVPTQGQTQEFLNRPDVLAAAGLGGQNSGGGGVAQQGGEGAAEVRPGTVQGGDGVAEVRPGTGQGGDGVAEVRPGTGQGGDGAAEVRPGTGQGGDEEEAARERIALVLRRQQGEFWAPGSPIGPGQNIQDVEEAVRMEPHGREEDHEDIEGVRVALVGEDQEEQEEATQATPILLNGQDLPSLEDLMNAQVPTLKWCPKAARGDFARELASLFSRLSDNPGEVRIWKLWFMFTRCILPAGRGSRAGDAYSMARLVRERLAQWRSGEYTALWEKAIDLTKVTKKRGRKKKEEEKSQEKRNAERATVLAQDGQYSKALQALTSAGMAPPSNANLKIMKEKHPAAPGNLAASPTTDVPQMSFGQAEVEKAVKKFRRGSAPGPSGLRPEHLKVALQAAPGRRERAL